MIAPPFACRPRGKTRPAALPGLLLSALLLAGCASFPELDGQPVAALRATDFQTGAAPVWGLDFGDAGLRRMLAEADHRGLDAASARARLRAADLALDQARRGAGVVPSASAAADRGGMTANAALRFEPDLAGRFDAAIQAAQTERAASGLDLLIARRTLARAVVDGWVGLGAARVQAVRLGDDIAIEQRALDLLRLRRAAGEATGADLAGREQALIRLQGDRAAAQGSIALAEARLRALGVTTIPATVALKGAQRPPPPARTDLGATQSAPPVCAAWLRFHAADASRAETLAAARPRLVVTSSLGATARTLAGLISGNAAALTNSVRLEGDVLDNGQSRARLDQARIAVAEAEINWLRARAQAEITALEAVTGAQRAEASLAAALRGWHDTEADRARTRARHQAGMSDALDLAEADRALAAAQREVDAARTEALRAAAALHDALPPAAPGCTI